MKTVWTCPEAMEWKPWTATKCQNNLPVAVLRIRLSAAAASGNYLRRTSSTVTQHTQRSRDAVRLCTSDVNKTKLLRPRPKWKKRSEVRKHCAGCSKVKPKFFAPPQTTFSGARDGQNLISWRRSLPLPTNPVWRGSMHAVSIYHGNRPHRPTVRPPQTGAITIHCAAA